MTVETAESIEAAKTAAHEDGHAHTSSRYDGHIISEFVYGTVTGLVTIVGIEASETTWWGATLIILTAAMGIWLAHAYSTILSKRIVMERRLTWHDLSETLKHSWPIVLAGAILTLPLPLVSIGAWTLNTALWISSITGILILALVGFLAGTITNETWPHRIAIALLSAALGVVVVVVKYLLHH